MIDRFRSLFFLVVSHVRKWTEENKRSTRRNCTLNIDEAKKPPSCSPCPWFIRASQCVRAIVRASTNYKPIRERLSSICVPTQEKRSIIFSQMSLVSILLPLERDECLVGDWLYLEKRIFHRSSIIFNTQLFGIRWKRRRKRCACVHCLDKYLQIRWWVEDVDAL